MKRLLVLNSCFFRRNCLRINMCYFFTVSLLKTGTLDVDYNNVNCFVP